MRTNSFSREKHLPVRRFIADESKIATGLYGPRAIADDLDNLCAMFDPDANLLEGTEKGGISEKNIQNGAITVDKLHPDLKQKVSHAVSEERLSQMGKSLTEELQKKADKADTLAGYGITDAYTQSEVSDAFDSVDQEMKTKASVEDLDKKLEETVLYEDVVNTPLWQNQPSVSGDLSGLNPTDFYYVTLKDALGNPLAGGQFMLKNSFADDATVYSALFSLSALNTGADTLTENHAVELTESYQFRDAGVSVVSKEIPHWSLSEGTGTIRTTLHGELIPKNINVYYYCDYKTDNHVSSHHSTNGTAAFQSDSTEDIVAYVSMPELQYPGNRVFDICTLRKDAGGNFSLDRNSVVNYQNNKAKLYQVVGYGNLHTQPTHITSIILRVNNPNNGLFRNGSVIRVTEVK